MLERTSENFSTKGEFFALILAIIAALVILFNNDSPQLDTIRSASLVAFAFVQEQFDWTSLIKRSDSELQELRKRTTDLMLENSQLRESLLENLRLRRMLDYRERAPFKVKSSRVLFRELNTTPNAFIINVGLADSIEINMPVVTPDGLAGKVYKVNDHTSHVQMMLDPNFSVSARTQRSRVLGIVTWSASSGLEMTGVVRNADIRHGDVIVTSDYSALYPPGIRIGIVDKIAIDEATFFGSISVIPFVDFSNIEEVFVIISEEQKVEPVPFNDRQTGDRSS